MTTFLAIKSGTQIKNGQVVLLAMECKDRPTNLSIYVCISRDYNAVTNMSWPRTHPYRVVTVLLLLCAGLASQAQAETIRMFLVLRAAV